MFDMAMITAVGDGTNT
uniref:Uncharacterized protein n=1 Tax=Arundo donax TaxID=35708 RepID=A0A0A8Y722_ARUDO